MSITLSSFNVHLNGRNPQGGGYYDLQSACKYLTADIMVFQENFYNFTEASNLFYPSSHQQIHQSIGSFDLTQKYHYDKSQDPKGEISVSLSTIFPIIEQRTLVTKPYGGDPRDSSLLAKLATPQGEIWVLGVHLTTGLLPLGSLLQIRALERLIPKNDPLIVMGDHNLWSPLVAYSLGKEFTQVVKGKTWPAHNPKHQIDQIFARGFITHESKVHDNLGSDHLAVTATLSLPL